MTEKAPSPSFRAATGIPGLDDVLHGGLPSHRLYLVQGNPGVGKTTLAMQFLLEGVRAGEKGLYITLSETMEEIELVAQSHGWDLSQLHLFELAAMQLKMGGEAESTFFHPAEVELNRTVQTLLEEVQRVQPDRVVFDSLSEMRMLAETPLRFRRQILQLKQFFAGRQCTVLFLDDRSANDADLQVESIAHGVISLQRSSPEYGISRRQLVVQKIRGTEFREGNHDFVLRRGGMLIFPRLVAAEHHDAFRRESFASGIAELDALLGGGLDRGTSNMFMGPPGTGKSTLAIKFAFAAAERGEKSLLYIFDETIGTFLSRASALGMLLEPHIAAGLINVQQVDPAEISPGELAFNIRRGVARDAVRFVVIDSINGYLNAMPEERFLNLQLHELLAYLNQQGVITIMVLAQQGLVGQMQSAVDLTYLADTVVLLRYFEARGVVKQAISVIKKRSGSHERTIREIGIAHGGLRVGQPLADMQGVLTGIPTFLPESGRPAGGKRMSAPPQPSSTGGGEVPILILAPLRNDALLTAEFLSAAGLRALPCGTAQELFARAHAGCGALLIAEEALDGEAVGLIGALLAAQPSWSELPVAIITSGGEVSMDRRSRLASLGPGGNVVLIERPFRPGTLVSTMEVALRSRGRQFQVRDLLEQSQRDAEARRAGEERYRLLAQEIARQSRMYQATLASTVDLLYVFDLQGRFVYTNRGLPSLLGRSAQEVIGKTFYDLGYPAPLADKLTRQIRQVIEQREPVRDETFVTNRDGTFAFEYIFAPVLGADGRVEAVAGSSRDITERRRVQQALEEQASALRDTDRRKDEFVAMLAHELRNPLSSISNAVTLLKEDGSPDGRRWAVDVIGRQSAQLSRLVDDLLDVSRITRGKIELRKSVIDAARCVESACEAVAPLIAERAHTLLSTLPRGELWLEADPTRLEQIVVNLLANAAKYTEPHGKIWLSARRADGEIAIEVRDSGIGVPAEKMAGMFELFAQGERTIARSEGGLGIGLTVVRGLCEMHGGCVKAYSAGKGKGSTFTVCLPAAAPPETLTQKEPTPAALDGASVRVLVVDDNVDTATGLARLLRRRGHTVELAHDGPAALAAATATAPQVVLLDIGLPGMTGYEVARALRSHPRCGSALVIALSGYGQEEDRRLSRDAGFDHHLVKPVDFEAVNALVAAQAGA